MVHFGIRRRCKAALLPLLVFGLLMPTLGARAQAPDQASPPAPVPTDPTATKTTDPNAPAQDADAPGSQDTAGVQQDNPFHVTAIGRASWLDPTVKSPIRIGPIYTSNISLSYLQGNGLHIDPTTQDLVDGTNRFAILRADLVYNHDFQRFGLTVQYLPQLAFSNGQFQTDFSDQNVSIGSSILLSPRWIFSFKNNFSSQNGQTLFGEFNLDVNNITGQSAGSPFLQDFHRQIYNDTLLSFDYRVNEKDTLTIAPTSHLNDRYINGVKTLAYDYGVQVSWGHSITERESVTVYANFDRRFVIDTLPVYNYFGLGAGYTSRLTQSLTVHGEVGLSTVGDSGGNRLTGVGLATIRKDFKSSNVSVSYTRGSSFGAFLSSGYSDRLDVGYDTRLGLRWSLGVGAAYETGGNLYSNGNFHGYYLNGRTAYKLGHGFTISANVGSRQQDGPAVGVYSGRTEYISSTLTWEPLGDQGQFGPY